MQNSSGKQANDRADFELIGYTGRRVIVAAGEDRWIGVGRLVDALIVSA